VRATAALKRLEPLLVGVGLTLPAWVWIARDRSVWPWDPAWYGEVSVDLWASLRLTTRLWPQAMDHAFAIKPPALAWLGQLFVPIGHALGSIRIALLSSIVIYSALTVALTYLAARRLCRGDRAAALVAALCVAGAPLFVSLGHEYFAEPLQTMTVAWVLLIAVSAAEWPPALTGTQLVAAGAFGLLVKLSTPAYIAAPAAAALILAALFGWRSSGGLGWRDLRVAVSAILAFGLLIGCIAWYRVNLQAALDHAELAAADTGLYGSQRGLGTELHEWLKRLEAASFLPYFIVVAVVATAAAAVRAAQTRPRPSLPVLLPLVACAVTVLGLILVFARQANDDPRFLAALIPLIALPLAAAVHAARSVVVTAALAGLLALQLAFATAGSFGAAPSAFRYDRITKPQRHSLEPTLRDMVRRTCPAAASGRINIVGAEYPWLNGNTLSLIASEEFALAGRQCQYTPLGYAEKSVDAAWNRVLALNPQYYLALDYGNPANRLPADLEVQATRPDAFNQVNLGVYHRALQSGRFAPVSGTRRKGLVVLRASGS
jgi:hypothetical protein